MKNTIKVIAALTLLLGAILFLAACSAWDTDLDKMNNRYGYTLTVRYDAGDGIFTTNTSVQYDAYNPSSYTPNTDGKLAISLLAPDDSRRPEAYNFEVSKENYIFVGWYSERSLRVNEQGEALDEYGELCSVSGKPQGYTYANKWDFETDKLYVDANGTFNANDPVLTLYAAWVPHYEFEFYAKDTPDGEWESFASVTASELLVPDWDKNGAMKISGAFPKRSGMTFFACYADAECTQKLSGTLVGPVDEATGTLTEAIIPIYTEWREGDWYMISTAEQWKKQSSANGNYIICADLDFADTTWSSTFINGVFEGTIEGNGHVFKNITVNLSNSKGYKGAAFTTLGKNAVIKDVTFEGLNTVLYSGSLNQGVQYGLLFGTVEDGATVSNVSLSGSIVVGAECIPGTYTVGFASASGDVAGVTVRDVDVVIEEGRDADYQIDTSNRFSITVSESTED